MIWWLQNPFRAQRERETIAELQESRAWLKNVAWRIAPGCVLVADFDIVHEGTAFPFTIGFSRFHPDAPPIVTPREEIRISKHQYGVGGSLCLEHRADNWHPDITGAMMIESAHRLIAGEHDAGADAVPSAHYVSLGQSLRGEVFRLLLTDSASTALRALQVGAPLEIEVAEKLEASTLTTTVVRCGEINGLTGWPSGVHAKKKKGLALRLATGVPLPKPTRDGLLALASEVETEKLADRLNGPGDLDLIIVQGDEIVHYYAYDGTETRQYGRSATVNAAVPNGRLDHRYAELAKKSVAVVGCGSLGSKMAAALARAGIRRFVLVDDDILFSDNLVRHDLDGSAVGVHKVSALKARLEAIVDAAEIVPRAVALGGQESAESTASVMKALAECDLIIDATADPHAFNFCAAAARSGLRPMVWGQVFAGGIGGIVARVRPDHEPDPQTARVHLDAWCESQKVQAPRQLDKTYGAEGGTGAALVADDAEVAIIAAHCTRLVIDTLLLPSSSEFPHSAYAVGLQRSWIFSGPFDTWPIDFPASLPWRPIQEAVSAEAAVALLNELLPEVLDDHDQSAA